MSEEKSTITVVDIPKCPSCGATLKTLNVYEEINNTYHWEKDKYGRSEGDLRDRKISCPQCEKELDEEIFLKAP